MANVSREIARSLNNSVIISLVYSDVSFNIRSITITNNGGGTVTVTVVKDGTPGTWTISAGPGQTFTDNLPNNLITLELDDTGNPAIPFSTLGAPVWYGEFGIWRWVVNN